MQRWQPKRLLGKAISPLTRMTATVTAAMAAQPMGQGRVQGKRGGPKQSRRRSHRKQQVLFEDRPSRLAATGRCFCTCLLDKCGLAL